MTRLPLWACHVLVQFLISVFIVIQGQDTLACARLSDSGTSENAGEAKKRELRKKRVFFSQDTHADVNCRKNFNTVHSIVANWYITSILV